MAIAIKTAKLNFQNIDHVFLINERLTTVLDAFLVAFDLALRGELVALDARLEVVLLLGVFLLSAI
ncbi:hypothetical protein PspMM1_08560 [Pseudoalteromonas sp. MM1]|jgi:hypothetical protein|nr:hypothetical protein PspMM1_08560 [Pseudoalteromonas sp. MM1]